MKCNQCDSMYINGVYCHERGCPDSWKNYSIECNNCGFEFIPDHKNQSVCSQECYNDYMGFPELGDLIPDNEDLD